MMRSSLFWVGLSLWLAGLCVWLSNVNLLTKMTWSGGYALWSRTKQKSYVISIKVIQARRVIITAVLAFVAGYAARDVQQHYQGNTFAAGYATRDLEAYRQLILRPNIHWRISRSYIEPHYKRIAYDLVTGSGQVVANFVPCENMGWYEGQVLISATYFNRGECMSFSGPAANWTIEPYQEAKATGKE